MGEFNSDDHYIYYWWQEFLRRNGVAFIVNERVQNAVLECSLKNDRMITICFQGKPFNIHSNPCLCFNTDAKEPEVDWFYEGLHDLVELTPKKDVLFIIGDWNPKVGSQEIPRITGNFITGLGVQNEAGKRLRVWSRENWL